MADSFHKFPLASGAYECPGILLLIQSDYAAQKKESKAPNDALGIRKRIARPIGWVF
jgi:hypothetical protein